MKRSLALMFLFIFATQVLPMKAIGRLFSKAQTEDVSKSSCDCNDDADTGNFASYPDFIMPSYCYFTVTRIIRTTKVVSRRYVDKLPLTHIAAIPSPPPNC